MSGFRAVTPVPDTQGQSNGDLTGSRWSNTTTPNPNMPPPPPPDGRRWPGGGGRGMRPPGRFYREREHSDPTRPNWMYFLMRHTHLLIYQDSGLTPAAFKNLATAAIFLVILWVFDAGAWTLLVNMLLTGTLLRFGALTLVAVLLGLLAATGILFYESSFITADLKRSANPRVAITIRLTVVLLVAAITSVPLDLALLDSQINRRIHQEAVLQQLPPLVREWEEAQERITGNALTITEKNRDTVKPRSELSDAEEKRDATKQAYQTAFDAQRKQAGLVNRLTGQLSNKDLDAQARQQVNRELQSAKTTLVSTQRSAAQQWSALQQAESDVSKKNLGLSQSEADIDVARVDTAAKDAKRYEDWINYIWGAAPLSLLTEQNPGQQAPMTYDGKELEGRTGVGERMVAMNDILRGFPPSRPKMSSGDLQVLKQMKLSEFIQDDPEALERERVDASSLRKLTLASLLVFTVFPALILALKMLFDEDTKRYFDSEYQRSPAGEQAAAFPPASGF